MAELDVAVMTLYLMMCTALVFLMHADFAMLEAGFTRAKNVANILGKNLMTISVGSSPPPRPRSSQARSPSA